MARGNTQSGGFVPASTAGYEPKTGTVVRVTFGNRQSTGTIVGSTITGRYNVKLDVVGADEPVTASFTRDQLYLPAS